MIEQLIFQRGEPIICGDLVEAGTLEAGHTMRARMKLEDQTMRGIMPGDSVATVTPAFTTTRVAATADFEEHFLHSLTAAQTATIAAGDYLFDRTLLLDGVEVSTTEPIRIVLNNSASGAT